WDYPGGLLGQAAPTITQPAGTVYGISIMAKDNAGHLEVPTTNQYVLDQSGPNPVAVSTPMVTMPYYGTARPLPTVSGTAIDVGPAGVAAVTVEIRDIS